MHNKSTQLTAIAANEASVILDLTMKIAFVFVATLLFWPLNSYCQQIALTFDDAPRHDTSLFRSRERVDELIKGLKKANVPGVIFFIRTSHINQRNRNNLKIIIDSGYYLANHSHNHKSLNRISAESYIKDIQLAHDILSKYKNFVPIFRYPYLHEGRNRESRDQVRLFLESINYRNGYVTVDSWDWYLDRLLQKAVRAKKNISYINLKRTYIEMLWQCIQFYDDIAKTVLGRSPKHVLLLHENDLAALFIADLVDFLRKQGWEIISTMEAYKDPIADISPDVLFSNNGRVAAIARSKGYQKKQLIHKSHSESYLNELFLNNNILK